MKTAAGSAPAAVVPLGLLNSKQKKRRKDRNSVHTDSSMMHGQPI